MNPTTRTIQQQHKAFRVNQVRRGIIKGSADFDTLFGAVCEVARLSPKMGKGRGKYDALEMVAVDAQGWAVFLCQVDLLSPVRSVFNYMMTGEQIIPEIAA